MFNICALRNIYTYVTSQQMHTDRLCFIIYYYSSTCFGRFCDHHQGVTQKYKKYTTIAQNVQLKSPDVTVNILSVPCGHKIADYVVVKNRQNWLCLCRFLAVTT